MSNPRYDKMEEKNALGLVIKIWKTMAAVCAGFSLSPAAVYLSLSVGTYRPAVLLDPAGKHHRAVRMLHLIVQNQAAQIVCYPSKAGGGQGVCRGKHLNPQKSTDKPVSRLQPGLQQYPPVK